MHVTPFTAATAPATVCCDVGAYTLNLFCRELSSAGSIAEWEIDNRTEAITATLRQIREAALARGFASLRLIVEPTGIYHRLLLRIARSLGFETATVDPAHVTKMRSVIFGDDGKTDRRDPHAIEAVANQGRLIPARQHAEAYALLRQWGKLYDDAEKAMVDAKSRVHRAMHLLFPDFDFTTDFLYGRSGQSVMRAFGFDPHVIATMEPARMYKRLRRDCAILRASVTRLITQARQTVSAVQKSRVTDLQVRELALAWEDFELAWHRRESARRELEALYDEVRAADRQLPDTASSPVSKVALARFLGEAGPLSSYRSWKQLLRMAGVNLRERKSGRYVGQTKIARAGRPLLRAIINQMALPLVKRDRLYGTYYHGKTGVQKMPGAKAMTAVSRKIVKMIWGWYQSGSAFDARRVFTCAGEYRRAA